MVIGIEHFVEKFRDFPECYTVIGGAACDILMADANLPFRATKDIDMILLLEDRQEAFVRVFWEYIREGGYRCGWKNNPDLRFYRFTEPDPGYPVQIELFSRQPDYKLQIPQGIVPLHISDELSSLSAILLNDEYYDFMKQGRIRLNGVSILDAAHLIPFKMFAWLDLRAKKQAGEHVNERDLRKHKLDVFRLLQIVPGNLKISVQGQIREDVTRFLDAMREETLDLNKIHVLFEREQALELLRNIYL